MLEDPIQKIKTSICGPFQIFFCDNLFLQDPNSETQMYKKLTKEALETLLNELFYIGQRTKQKHHA